MKFVAGDGPTAEIYTNEASAQYETRRLRWDGRSAYTIQRIRIGEKMKSLYQVFVQSGRWIRLPSALSLSFPLSALPAFPFVS